MKLTTLTTLITLFFFFVDSPLTFSQNEDFPKLYLDCDRNCYRDYLRSSIVNVNFMRDRQDADVFVKMYSSRTGGGGTSYRLEVTGKGRFEGITFTNEFFGNPVITDKEEKEQLKAEIDKILIPFWLTSNTSPTFKIEVDEQQSDGVLIDEIDPWNYWVFRIGLSGNMNGQEQHNRSEVNSNLNISRVTDQGKFFTGGRLEYENEKFIIDNETIKSLRKNWSTWAMYVHSLNEHWSVGSGGYLSSSTYSNYDIRTKLSAAIEYNVFPYSESTERQFTFLYKIGGVYHDYADTTIYLKTKETLLHQSLDVQYEIDEDWGSARFRVSGGNYLHDFDLFNLTFAPFLNWNIFKGFSIHCGAHVSWIRDQLSLPKTSVSSEEVLLQIRQLQTNYSFGAFGGINYRFGSDKNNVVNRRFSDFFD